MDVRDIWLVVAIVGTFHGTSGHDNADGGGGTRKGTVLKKRGKGAPE